MTDWDDLRHFLAVADAGSTLGAGRALRVSQTTVARRIAALEASLGLRLFDRRQAGYQLTVDGAALVPHARSVALGVDGFIDTAAARARAIAGTVRLTVNELLAVTILSPMLRDFHLQHPAVRIELDTSDDVRDLDAGAADVALRVAARPAGAGLVGRRIADDFWTVYCSTAYAAEHGVPRTLDALRQHPIVGGGEPGVWRYYREWLVACGLEDAVVMEHNSSIGLLAAVRSGFGLAVLPTLVADQEPDLIRCLPTPASDRSLWLLTHERVRHEPRVRALIDFLVGRFAILPREPALAGQPATRET